MRLPDADPAASPELAAAFAEFQRTRGIVSNVMKSFAHAPKGLAAIVELGSYCRYGTDLTELQKELVILITGRGVEYAWHHHAPLGLKAGLTEAQLQALREGRTPEGLSETDSAVCDYAFAYASLKGLPDAVFERATKLLTPRQITDINITAGYYLLVASSIIAMQVEPDPPQVVAQGTSHHAGGARGGD